MNHTNNNLRIAVVGAGVAGIVAAYLLGKKHSVTLYEGRPRLGGHTNTVVVPTGPSSEVAVDTGFIVLNDQTYPLFSRFLSELNVPVRFSDMSFGFYDEACGTSYAGTSLSGLFADKRNLLSPTFYRFLLEISRFCRDGQKLLVKGTINGRPLNDLSLAEFVKLRGYSKKMVNEYLLPMTGAIWSASNSDALRFPIGALLSFYKNHGLLGIKNRPRWQTVVGGSHSYLKAFNRVFSGDIRLASPVEQISRFDSHVTVRAANESSDFDVVVVACHADESLKLLAAPSDDEQRLLGAWQYQNNLGWLHTDTSLLPPNSKAWASWNYCAAKTRSADSPVAVTYYMNLLQGLVSDTHYCVTYNSPRRPKESSIITELNFTHPTFSVESFRTQSELPHLNGKNRTYFCGSYFGYGFHEDAVRSSVEVAKAFGIAL